MSKAKEPGAITLRHPVTVEGQAYAELKMRRALARDSRDAQREGGPPAAVEIRLFANLCEVPPEVVGALDMADYVRLQEKYHDFLDT